MAVHDRFVACRNVIALLHNGIDDGENYCPRTDLILGSGRGNRGRLRRRRPRRWLANQAKGRTGIIPRWLLNGYTTAADAVSPGGGMRAEGYDGGFGDVNNADAAGGGDGTTAAAAAKCTTGKAIDRDPS